MKQGLDLKKCIESLIDHTTHAFIVIDLEANILQVNQAFEEMYGWPAGEIIGQSTSPLIPHYLRESTRALYEKVRAGGHVTNFETQRQRRDGSLLHISITISPIHDQEGEVAALAGISRDITEQKRIERALRESNERYRCLVEFSSEPIAVHADGWLLFINNAGAKLFGAKDAGELIGRQVLDFVHPDYQNMVRERIDKSYVNRTNILLIQEKFITLQGEEIDVEVATTAISYEGKPATQVMIHDITEQKNAEEALRRSEERLRRITDNMLDMIAETDEHFLYTYVSPAHNRLLGYTEKDMLSKPVFDFVHPDEKRLLRAETKAMAAGHSLSGRRELRGRHANGHYVWLEVVSTLLFNQEGVFTGMVFTLRDITERKKAEMQLEEMNRTLHRLSFIDGLTGIMNRRYFDDFLDMEWKRATLGSVPLSAIMVDIDCFKAYNDTYSHLQGDECLKKVARTLQVLAKRPRDFVARYGGEEFILLLPTTALEGAMALAEQLRRQIEALAIPHLLSPVSSHVTISLGVAGVVPDEEASQMTLIEAADRALYKAKQQGRNRVCTGEVKKA
ncbi:PAS domain S-box protein [Aneurinibacillus tyrosinisolvens]|uniref:PAS domain S-box protein n=1 Tax=Aneurinibacillus tyrosinisolvens TaxID=1443435 RepID=UPI000699A9B9|nr:PAS domain S-box protein [Aneurinibacillus tyrosinisolvens]